MPDPSQTEIPERTTRRCSLRRAFVGFRTGALETHLDALAETALEDQRERRSQALTRRERLTTASVGGAFLAAACAFAALTPWNVPLAPATVAVLVVVYALASSVHFEVGTGVAVPTQLVLVPMLLLAPLPVVPLLVAAGLILASLHDSISQRAPLDRALAPLASGWHALGPAAVLLAASPNGAPSLEHWPFLVAALAAQFALDASSAAVGDRIALGPLPARYLSAFLWVFLIDACLAPIGFVAALAATESAFVLLAIAPLLALLGFFARERRARLDHALELSSAYRGTALLLGDVIEADDEYTGSHSRDVVELVIEVADELGLDAQARRQAEFTALLHDVGKIRIPGELVNKRGPLTESERALMQTHTIEGERLLAGVGGALAEIGHLVRSCHERFDGQGYPDGLLTDEIPLVSRIVACCDAFNAMTTDRSYRKALPHDVAVQELRRNAGTQFDPVVVAALLRVLERARQQRTPSPAASPAGLRLLDAA